MGLLEGWFRGWQEPFKVIFTHGRFVDNLLPSVSHSEELLYECGIFTSRLEPSLYYMNGVHVNGYHVILHFLWRSRFMENTWLAMIFPGKISSLPAVPEAGPVAIFWSPWHLHFGRVYFLISKRSGYVLSMYNKALYDVAFMERWNLKGHRLSLHAGTVTCGYPAVGKT